EYFHFLLTNPPIRPAKNLVHPIFQEPYQNLKNQPQLYLLIHKNQPIPSPKNKIQQIFNNLRTLNKTKGYYIFNTQKA
ncbi:methyltransferase, partial [Staphylococcus hominis]|uniref:methyltransferase n=1 Tax=Staphylococcus hominis TaxID=1290 RepID=UPI00119E2040